MLGNSGERTPEGCEPTHRTGTHPEQPLPTGYKSGFIIGVAGGLPGMWCGGVL